ncbi:MAG: DNA-binding protein [Fusobacteriia bacterium 4572_74]|nr:MAG: DNA-binding protein [Fusobacteriia bacterium 4572_74]
MNLGEKIKFFRKEQKMTIKDLSGKTSLSVGFISNIERGQNSPSISNLQQICAALEVNLMEVLQDVNEQSPITRREERKTIFESEQGDIAIETLTNVNHSLNGISITISDNNQHSDFSWGHNYDEVGVIIEGSLEIELNNKLYTLNEGDSIYIEKFQAHKYRNPTKNKNITHWFSLRK